jgi:predicted ATPase
MSLYPLIEGFWIRNYKALRQIAIGSSFQQSVVMDFSGDVVPYELTPFTLFAGDSETGKSTILDAFAFLADCLNLDVNEALRRRGGFEAVRYFGEEGPISIGIVYRPCAEQRSLTYMLNIGIDKKSNHPFVETEAIVYRDHQPNSQPQPVLLFKNGSNRVRHVQPWVGVSGSSLAQIKETNNLHLGLAALAEFEDLPDIPLFKLYLDKFFVSHYIASNAAKLSPPQFKMASEGNLAHDLKRFKEKHPTEFDAVWDIMTKKLPGVEKAHFELSDTGRLVLSFNMTGHNTPVYPAQLGEGTLRLLSHLTLLEDPIPTPLLGIEEPAAFMGYSQIVVFVELLQRHIRELGGTQFFATTNSSTLIDQMDPTEVWFLVRDNNGMIQASRGLDELQFLNVDIDTIGPFWYSQYLYVAQKTNPMMGGSSVLRPPSPQM